MQNLKQASRALSDEFLSFVNKGLSPYHVVEEGSNILLNSGFTHLSECDHWELKKGGKYFFTRNKSTLIAFTVGQNFDANNTGFKLIGAHTDSPVLKLAPVSKLVKQQQEMTCISTYGGGLWHTWFDRDLSLAGKVVYTDKDGKLESCLWKHDKALLKVPSLCIHLESAKERESFEIQKENQLLPILSNKVYEELTGTTFETKSDLGKKHYAGLIELIAKEINQDATSIVDFDLCFVDTQKADYFGLSQEFISSPRLDNLFSVYFALRSIAKKEIPNDTSFINMVLAFDHEECGSQSFQGAASSLLKTNMERIFTNLASQEKNVQVDSIQRMFFNSYMISVDMAHAVHPNYSHKHKDGHQPQMNKGIVLKYNYNQRYTTDSISSSIIRKIAEIGQVPLQDFAVRNDSACGSTIGPMISSNTGIKAVDIGAPQLSMHSIRETCGIIDCLYQDELFTSFFKNYEKVALNLLKN